MVHNKRKKVDMGHLVTDVLNWFLETNTLGGLSSSYHADNSKSGLYWFILFLAGCGLTLLGIRSTVVEYCKHNSLTKISYQYPSQLTLPAVAICHSNRIHCYNLYDTIRAVPEVRIFLVSP